MKYKFNNGAEVEGTLDAILKIASSLGETVNVAKLGEIPRGYYKSANKGVLRIEEMSTYHLRNALVKIAKTHYEGLTKSKEDNAVFLKEFISLPEVEKVEELYEELSKRSE